MKTALFLSDYDLSTLHYICSYYKYNENLDKDFIKNLSNKLYEWTSKRWIISLSKSPGQISKKEKNKIDEKKIFDDVKKSEAYKKVIEAFPDAELINVELKEDKNDWFFKINGKSKRNWEQSEREPRKH